MQVCNVVSKYQILHSFVDIAEANSSFNNRRERIDAVNDLLEQSNE